MHFLSIKICGIISLLCPLVLVIFIPSIFLLVMTGELSYNQRVGGLLTLSFANEFATHALGSVWLESRVERPLIALLLSSALGLSCCVSRLNR
jgi:hypothetical protein